MSDPLPAQQLMPLALEHHRAGDLVQADRLYAELLRSNPHDSDAHHLRGVVAHQCGQHQAAVRHIELAIALNPYVGSYHSNLGLCFQALGRVPEAVAALRRAVELAPDLPEALSNLGNVLVDMGSEYEAEDLCRKAVRLRPNYPEGHNNLANALSRQGRVPEAIASYRAACQLDPHFVGAMVNLGHALQEVGDFQQARQLYEQALDFEPADSRALYGLTQTGRFSEPDHPHRARVEAVLRSERLSARNESNLHFALAKMADDSGQFDRAFAHFRRGNELVRPFFDRRQHQAEFSTLINFFTADRFAQLPGGNPSEAPVFIVGMPRSGTSLVEQILASHSQVHGWGECVDLSQAAKRLTARPGGSYAYPEGLCDVSPSRIAQEAARLLDLRSPPPGKRRYTDKMPTNFIHLGLIAWLFPRARVIHVQRHPLDSCLSCYFRNFSATPAYASDLGDLGFYHGEYLRLMDHWRKVLPLEMLSIRYEELVRDTEAQSRRLVEFCGLTWEENCLNFHRNRRAVQTSSSWQVRQPIYDTSIGRWRHYAAHLGPLREALDPDGTLLDRLN